MEKKIRKSERIVAYFTMEIGLDPRIPTYSGGLGILAGDTLKAAAALSVPIIGVTLLNEKGYFRQVLDEEGRQREEPVEWKAADFMKLKKPIVSVEVEEREVNIRAWEYIIHGRTGYKVPVYFLDTNLSSNDSSDRTITSFLYGGDQKFRLIQEIILGIGGVRMIEALGYSNILKYHMNEGHASLLTVELVERTGRPSGKKFDVESVRRKCIFTTHTPVPAGHDKFPQELVREVLGHECPHRIPDVFMDDGKMNMTLVALNLSQYINGVAKRHGEVTRTMFPNFPIDSITNGVHSGTWASEPFRHLFDKHIPGWEADPFTLRYALSIPEEEIWHTHQLAKEYLLQEVKEKTGKELEMDVFTIGFARRMTAYKRPNLLFQNMDKLLRVAERGGKFQLVFAGKAHPRDEEGKKLIQHIFAAARELEGKIEVAFIPNYDMRTGGLMTAGVDLWLNTPLRPREASGTSGMKACHNGVPSFSVLDGWWLEGCIEGVTGWSIGSWKTGVEIEKDQRDDLDDLYNKLEYVILPKFYTSRDKWVKIMRNCIGLNASFFNTYRMIQQYITNAYFHSL